MFLRGLTSTRGKAQKVYYILGELNVLKHSKLKYDKVNFGGYLFEE